AIEEGSARLLGYSLGTHGHDPIHEFLALIRIGVLDKAAEIIRFRQSARQIQRNPANKLCIRAERSVGDFVAFDLLEYIFIDVVFWYDADRRSQGQSFAQILCLPFQLRCQASVLLRVMSHRGRRWPLGSV